MNIGLHIRLHETITAVAQKALQLELPFFQTFVLNVHGHFFSPSTQDKKNFLELRNNFGPLFLHASYWINCASSSTNVERLLDRELALANMLAFDFYIVHPGAAPIDRHNRFDVLVKHLKVISKRYPHIHILLENVAHAHNTIGGSLQELGTIARALDDCKNIGFCIDTAHAHSYGYNINTQENTDHFLKLIDQEIDLKRVLLVHLNNTTQECGSHIDTHSITTKGTIDIAALKYLVNAKALQKKFFIAELPTLSQDKEKAILTIIRDW